MKVKEEEISKEKVTYLLLTMIALISLCIVGYFINHYIDKPIFNITYTSCYNNGTDCLTYELSELRVLKGFCNDYRDLPCIVEKDCGLFNETDYDFTNCSYYAYESIKKEDITLSFLGEECDISNSKYVCFEDYEVRVI